MAPDSASILTSWEFWSYFDILFNPADSLAEVIPIITKEYMPVLDDPVQPQEVKTAIE